MITNASTDFKGKVPDIVDFQSVFIEAIMEAIFT